MLNLLQLVKLFLANGELSFFFFKNSTLREDIDANETENDVDRVTQPTEPKSKKRRAGPQQEPGIKPKKAKKAKK